MSTSSQASRNRIEGGKSCVDVRLRTAQHLFDGRDPAPFRERDLDEKAVDYIVGSVEDDSPHNAEIKLVFWIAEPASVQVSPETITEAVRGHFGYELEKLARRTREHRRQGRLTLAIGLSVLTVFLALAEFTTSLPEGHLRPILREGLLITGWVAMWRPLEVLLYDWWPLSRQRRLIERIQRAEVTVVHGTGERLP